MGVQMTDQRVSIAELHKHNTKTDCWIAIHSKVWDITEFINEHPGGSAVLLRCAGSNASQVFDQVHAPDIIDELPEDKFKGFLHESPDGFDTTSQHHEGGDVLSLPETTTAKESTPEKDELVTDLTTMISASDFEQVAFKVFSPKTWAFYSSAATDLITHKKNKELVRRIMIRPRVLRDVTSVCIERDILGFRCKAPFFISPTAMARLAHPDGELAFSRAAANEDIIYCVSNNASYTLRSIVAAAPPSQPFFFQLYINSERKKTLDILKTAKELGVKAIFVTVDAPVPGKREADERAAQEGTVKSAISGGESGKDKRGSGFGRLMAQYIDKSLTWEDLSWIREASGLPIVLKGIQTADDVKLAVRYGVDAVLLSNHGGRSLDGSQASILVLLELRKQCPEVFQKLEIYVDGGFERGSDILKAIALGATAVGIGRPFLYSLSYGQAGVEHLCQILKDELETSMRLCGITCLEEANPRLVNTLDVDYLVTSGPSCEDSKPRMLQWSKL